MSNKWKFIYIIKFNQYLLINWNIRLVFLVLKIEIEFQFDYNINISLKNVSFYYPTNKQKKILDDVSINFLPGKINAIVGQSGCGKSTIMSLLLRL
jgi:ABC-type multidrug transport system fused ATPase/permease subunit